MEDIVALCKRRGFIYPASDIYGGLSNTWDFGHYGVLLKNNLRDLWWKNFVLDRDDMVGLEASIFLNPKVWEASGHVQGFTDALVDCRSCKTRTRADHLIEDRIKGIKVEGLPVEQMTALIKKEHIKCPRCGKDDLTEVRTFNLLFETYLGTIDKTKSKVYLRGEIAQGIFLNFKNVLNTMRLKIPFGIAQQGKAFRNEITMGQFVHRTLEFDLMELEYFIKADEWEKIFEMWKTIMWNWVLSLGIQEKNIRWREHEEHERSFYSKKTMDIEYKYPFGWKEMFGLAYRTDYDISNHMKKSGHDLTATDPLTGKTYLPHVIEPTFGLSRLLGIILFDAYREDEVKGKKRIFLKVHPFLAPVKAAIFPLQKDSLLVNKSKEIYKKIKKACVVEWDNAGNIGKMYRRQDEIGTPYCITVDYDSIKSDTVTIRDRDTTHQERINIDSIIPFIKEKTSIL